MKLKVDQSLLNTWDKSHALIDLYHRRALGLEPEMTCAAQAREILTAEATFGDSVLDVGCGTAWFAHSVQRAQLGLQYFGIDKTEKFIEIARQALESSVLAPDRLFSGAIEHSFGEFDHVVCMNVLSNLDNWHRPAGSDGKLGEENNHFEGVTSRVEYILTCCRSVSRFCTATMGACKHLFNFRN